MNLQGLFSSLLIISILIIQINGKSCSETLKRGSRGECVKVVQKAVGATVDGVYEGSTESAVKNYQRKNKLPSDGIVGHATWGYIHADRPEYKACKETLQRGSRGDCVKLVQKAVDATVDGVYGSSTESAVKKLQRSNNLYPDGVVGPKTWDAVRRS